MLLKLYKVQNDILNYWEIWDTDTGFFVHWGRLGDVGENKASQVKPSKLKATTDQLIQQKFKEGYSQLEDNQLNELIIQFSEYEDLEELDFREAIQNDINQTLGWTGNGHSTDADIGNGTINIFANVIDPYLACETIHASIKETGTHRDYLIALKKQSGFEVLYPKNFLGDFTY